MKRSNNKTSLVLCLAVSAVLVAACDNAMNLERTVTELKNDVSGEYSFEVEVRYGELLPESEALWVLDNMEIVPFEVAFPGAEKPAIEQLSYDDSELDTEGIQVTLRPLDADVSPGDFAWRIPLRDRPEHLEQASELQDGLKQKESPIITPGTSLGVFQEIYDGRYYCLVYTVSTVFCPASPTCNWFGCFPDSGRVCVDQGRLGNAGTTCHSSNCNPVTIVKSRITQRAYWRARVKSGKSGGIIANHLVSCL